MGARDGDGWDRAYVYEHDVDGKWFRLRSLGPNGVDEYGAGDDLEVSDTIPEWLERREREGQR